MTLRSECCRARLRVTCSRDRDGRREAHVRCERCGAGGCILRDNDTLEVVRRLGPAVNLRRSAQRPGGLEA